ncbi:MAG TPA: type VI secretion system tube protein Hcp [Candidatus Cloacimonadota bacterium]|jgi:type VI secretion system Hcp family effector|nr:type VI secretion system tube protein Hcp [Candidatus Cloacimonadota bacterium]
MRVLIAIIVAVLILIPAVSGATITDVRWNANLKVIEILFDKFPAKWGGWTMYIDGKEWPMEGGGGNAVVRPNAPAESATGLFIGADPWITGLTDIDFPCCGKIQFQIPDEGFTHEYEYSLIEDGCSSGSEKTCQDEYDQESQSPSLYYVQDIAGKSALDSMGGPVADKNANGIYLFLDGMSGDVTLAEHKGWIEVLNFSYRIPETGEFQIIKFLDRTSPEIYLKACEDSHFPAAKLEIIRNGYPIMKYTLYDVRIKSIQVSSAEASNWQEPLETIDLSYDSVEWVYTPIKSGGLEGEVTTGWNFETGNPLDFELVLNPQLMVS